VQEDPAPGVDILKIAHKTKTPAPVTILVIPVEVFTSPQQFSEFRDLSFPSPYGEGMKNPEITDC
jgi:hypothetical protein